ncbi:acid protease [Hymenopellis radicata]|nr:acid protease [Hymenopellis radicata]
MHHLLLLAISSLAGISSGLRLEVEGRRRAPLRRAITGVATLKNAGDISYSTTVTLGGQDFSCLIDTGSSDLWVAGTVPSAQDTGATSGVTYAVGSAKGPVKIADMKFAGYEISNQAFMQVPPDADNKQGQGILGLGPNSGSNIYNTLQSDAGFAVVDRIFLQNTSTPNFISIALGRVQDPDSADSFPGNITVGDILDGYDAITNEPKLAVTTVSVTRAGDQHFQILLDQNGLLGPDGNPIAIHTEVQGTSNGYQATAVVDSGFSLSQLPKAAADAIYGRFSGAEFVNVNGVGNAWIVPCDQEVNITFKFSGQEYHIHPMDATLDPSLVGISSLKNSKGQDCCVGLFQPIIFDTGDQPTYDMILGMSFMRNVYALLNYGDFIDEDQNRGAPYIQFLSITDPAEVYG